MWANFTYVRKRCTRRCSPGEMARFLPLPSKDVSFFVNYRSRFSSLSSFRVRDPCPVARASFPWTQRCPQVDACHERSARREGFAVSLNERSRLAGVGIPRLSQLRTTIERYDRFRNTAGGRYDVRTHAHHVNRTSCSGHFMLHQGRALIFARRPEVNCILCSYELQIKTYADKSPVSATIS